MLYIILLFFLLLLGFKLKEEQRYFKYYIYALLTALVIFLSIKFGKILFALIAFLIPFILRLSSFLLKNFGLLRWFWFKNRSTVKTDNNIMSKMEAYQILGLNEGASKADIKLQYKKLMKANHPDKGGSKHLAMLLNRAKDILLND
ncbi:MAG: DnaJ domain-containing protein [Rickettsiales bacterium]